MSHLFNAIDEQVTPWFKERSQGAYRVGQVRRWLFGQRVSNFCEMTDLPQALRDGIGLRFHVMDDYDCQAHVRRRWDREIVAHAGRWRAD